MTINELSADRKRLLKELIDNKMLEGFKRWLTDLYPDNAHFIYELLQNAEDAGASEVQFILNADRLEFEHNGPELFNINHVESITNIRSTKTDDPTNIGKFGIGFKAVFAYTSTPEIESDKFHFRICDMIVPNTEGLSEGTLGARRTRFVFPFDNPEKPPEKAAAEIEKNLRELNESTLLFLNNIHQINYNLPNSKTGSLERRKDADDGNRIEISVKHPESTLSKSTHYLRFTKKVDVQDEDDKPKCCEIAIAFGMDKTKSGNWKIVPLNPGQVCIYFPAIKETSNLRLHIHAPFASTVARDSVRDCPANDKLRDHIADLVAESMHSIRDQGLLDMRFLATLPNNKDDLSSFYNPIRERLIEEFKQKKLTPMKQKGHAPALECYRGQKKLPDLINDKDLATLLGKCCSQPLWIANPQQKNQRADNFLSMLRIPTWTITNLVEVLETFEDVTKWLNEKSEAWHQKLYAFLGDFLSSSDSAFQERKYQLSKLCIVRCNDKTYKIGSECRFPNDDTKSDPPTQEKGFYYVAKGVYSYGKNKSQQEKAHRFLDEIGVSEWNIVAEVLGDILPKYQNSSPAISRTEYNRDFTKIVKAYKTDDSQKKKQQLQEALMAVPFIRTKDSPASNPIYLKPDQLYFGVEDVLWHKNPPGTYSSVVVTKKVREFLQKLKIPQWDIVDEVIETILPKYEGNPPSVSIKEHMNDFKKITRAYNTHRESKKMQLKTKLKATHFILAENPNADFQIYLKPDQLYFGTDDDLRMYFERDSPMLWIGLVKDPITALWEYFAEPDTGAFVDLDKYPKAARALFIDLGIVNTVRVKREEKNWQGYVVVERSHGRHQRGLDGFDPNVQVDGLAPALDSPTPEKSAFIWNHIAIRNVNYIKGIVEKSRRQDYTNPDSKKVLSHSFGGLLVTKAWLPDIDGNMHKPSKITLAELPESFQRDERLAAQLDMKKDEVAELAEKAGVPVEVIDKISRDPELCAKVEELIVEQEARERREKKISEQPIQDENIFDDEPSVDTSSIPSESLTDVGEEDSSSTAKDSETPEGSGHTDSVENKSPHTSSRPSVSASSSQDSSQGETSHKETHSGNGQHEGNGNSVDILLPEEISETEGSYEGARKQISVNTYERDQTARDKCLQYHGTSCAVCEKNMSEIYGPVAAGLIHVHHLKPLSEIKEDYQVSPIADLRPVCPNCHAVIHRRKPLYKIEEVKGFLQKAKHDE